VHLGNSRWIVVRLYVDRVAAAITAANATVPENPVGNLREILDAIGARGMGEVYGARDVRLGRTAAIKILAAHLSSDPVRSSGSNVNSRSSPA
jgi:hypothetical protein